MRSLARSAPRVTAPGDLTEKIAFQAETRTPDGMGGFTSGWATSFEDWAEAAPLYVSESDRQGAQRNVTQYRFTLYRRNDVTEQMRILWEGVSYNIRGIRREGAQRLFMEIIAETGGGD